MTLDEAIDEALERFSANHTYKSSMVDTFNKIRYFVEHGTDLLIDQSIHVAVEATSQSTKRLIMHNINLVTNDNR